MTKGMRKYFKKKIFWFIITFIAAVVLNFILPRLMPGDPVNSIVGKNISPGATQEQVQEQITYYKHQFGLDKNIFGQFWDFVKNAFNGTFGVSYSQYPRLVSDIIGSSIWWTVALQLPAILVGWLLGNLLGALAAYKRSFYDKALMPLTLFFSAIPAFGASVILLVIFAVTLGWAPVNGAFDPGMIANAAYYLKKGVLVAPLHFQFCMGCANGIPGSMKNLLFMKETMEQLCPGSTWSTFGVGHCALEMLYGAVALGGHIRVGMEDNVMYGKGQLADSNRQFVERAARVIREYGNEVATPDEAREILGLKK